jgi:acetolactate synthase-1/2/3 large subunit
VKDLGPARPADGATAREVQAARETWLKEWMSKLTSDEVPITPYRVIRDFMHTIDPARAIVTHDSGSPRNQLVPFYRATAPRSDIGWGKSPAGHRGPLRDMGRAMGGYAERVEKPAEIVGALERARKMNDDGKAVLLEFITSEEIAFSHRRAL